MRYNNNTSRTYCYIEVITNLILITCSSVVPSAKYWNPVSFTENFNSCLPIITLDYRSIYQGSAPGGLYFLFCSKLLVGENVSSVLGKTPLMSSINRIKNPEIFQ